TTPRQEVAAVRLAMTQCLGEAVKRRQKRMALVPQTPNVRGDRWWKRPPYERVRPDVRALQIRGGARRRRAAYQPTRPGPTEPRGGGERTARHVGTVEAAEVPRSEPIARERPICAGVA